MFSKLFWGFTFFCSSINAWAGGPQFKHVVVVIFENASYSNVVKDPFFAKVAAQGALFTQFIAESHPSQPNYIALVSGDTQGVRSDSNVDLNSTHIGTTLKKAGLDWKVYAENLPNSCFLGSAQGRYVRKHVPFYSFTDVQKSAAECAKIVDATEFQRDLSKRALPAFSLYIPNLDNDGHDTGVSYASKWFSGAFSSVFSDAETLKDTLFVITFDESDNFIGKNQVYTVLLGANVVPGTTVNGLTSHYSVLRTIEDAYSLQSLGRKDQTSSPISGIWR